MKRFGLLRQGPERLLILAGQDHSNARNGRQNADREGSHRHSLLNRDAHNHLRYRVARPVGWAAAFDAISRR